MIVINTSYNRAEFRRLEEISEPIKLSKQEFKLLKALAGNDVVSNEDLVQFVLHARFNKRNHATLRNLVNRLRKKGFKIRSSYSQGYQLMMKIAIE